MPGTQIFRRRYGSRPIGNSPIPGEAYAPVRESALNDTDKKIIRIAAYTLGTAVLGSALFFTARYFYRKNRKTSSDKLSLNDGTAENYAKRLQMAFDNDGFWGTDVEEVRAVFTELPSQQMFSEVVKEYNKQANGKRELLKDLEGELTTSEHAEMQSILAAKPEKTGQKTPVTPTNKAIAWAKRLKAAFDYTVMGMPATDKGAVSQVLTEIPSKYFWYVVMAYYKRLFGTDLDKDMDSELDIFDFSWRAIINAKPN